VGCDVVWCERRDHYGPPQATTKSPLQPTLHTPQPNPTQPQPNPTHPTHPPKGFVESFNVSVAAALIMWEAQQQRLRRLGQHGDLSDLEMDVLMAEYLIRGVVSVGLGGGSLLRGWVGQ